MAGVFQPGVFQPNVFQMFTPDVGTGRVSNLPFMVTFGQLKSF